MNSFSLQEFLLVPRCVVFLTGAGVSTDSGIPDFKQLDETWPFSIPRAEMNSLPFFMQEPELFWDGYWHLLSQKSTAEPNSFHFALPYMESQGHAVTVLTQNVDGLHRRAGASSVLEFHGAVDSLVCEPRGCGGIYPTASFIPGALPLCENCERVLKPNVSLFFEGVNFMAEARESLLEAELVVVAGTSLRVGPVNELPYFVQYQNPTCVQLWVNQEAPSEDYDFFELYEGDCAAFARAATHSDW